MNKGIFLWRVKDVLGGDPGKIAALLKSANISRVDVKVAQDDKAYRYWRYTKWETNVTREWVRAMQGLGIKVWGWGFLNGRNPAGEGMIGASQSMALKLDGYGFNCESTFESHGDHASRAGIVAGTFKDNAPDVPACLITWSLWRNPWTGAKWHNETMAVPFMQVIEYAMPMCYFWNTYSILWLLKCIEQWRNMVHPTKPIIPVGRAYGGEGLGTLNPAEVKAFGEKVRELNLEGESWWELRHALKRTVVWNEIKALPDFGVAPPQPPTVEDVVRGLTDWAIGEGYDGPTLP